MKQINPHSPAIRGNNYCCIQQYEYIKYLYQIHFKTSLILFGLRQPLQMLLPPNKQEGHRKIQQGLFNSDTQADLLAN